MKNQHSDYIMNIYYITVKFYGDVYVPPVVDTNDTEPEEEVIEEYVKTKINFTITDFDWKSKGQL